MDNQDNSILKEPGSQNSLSKWNDRLIEEGLRISNQFELNASHVFKEPELDSFIQKYYSLRKQFFSIPTDFVNLLTNNPHKVINAFDPNSYFSVFDKISLLGDYVLDYVYVLYSEPLLYSRKINDDPIDTVEDFFCFLHSEQPNIFLGDDTTYKGKRDYLNCLSFEKSFIGYFQYGLFCLLADHFYRSDHSCYGDKEIILTKNGFEKFINRKVHAFDNFQLNILEKVDFYPSVTISGRGGILSLLSYDPIGEGLDILRISIEWPNQFIDVKYESIIKGHSYLL